MIRGGVPPALISAEALGAALGAMPSRREVGLWMECWPQLDRQVGEGHALLLEDAMFGWIRTDDRKGFRSAWLLGLLAASGQLNSLDPAGRMLEGMGYAPGPSIEREMLRGLLALPWSEVQRAVLLEWAVNVVHVEDHPVAAVHHALKVLERSMGMSPPIPGSSGAKVMQEALHAVRRTGHSHFVKQKAALMLARLSS